MADDPKGTVGGQTPAPGEAPPTNEPRYITEEQFIQFSESLKKGLADNFRAVQSRTDSYQHTVQTKLQQFEESLKQFKAAGIDITDDKIAEMRNQLVIDTLAGGEEPADPNAPGQAPPGKQADDEEEIDPITAEALSMMQAAGVEIEDDDPESDIIQAAANGSIREYFNAVDRAIKAKQERLGASAQVRMPNLSGTGSPASNPIAGITDPTELWNIAMREGKIRK